MAEKQLIYFWDKAAEPTRIGYFGSKAEPVEMLTVSKKTAGWMPVKGFSGWLLD